MVDTEEAAQDFLDRLDLDPEDFESRQTVQAALDELFQDVYGVDATSAQVDAIFNAGDLSKVQFPNVGIQKIQFVSRGRTQTRYLLPFQKGLFGFEKALDLYNALS